MQNKITYYAAANCGEGRVSYFGEYLRAEQKKIVLKNATRLIKRELFSGVEAILGENEPEETIITEGYAREIGAMILPERSILLSDEAYFEDFSGDTVFDFANCLKNGNFAFGKSVKENDMYAQTARYLKEAKAIHDDWEKIYIENMDFDKLNDATESLIQEIFSGISPKNAEGENVNRFFGTLLTQGSKNYINQITADIKNRIFIKGRPGTGKSTVLKKIRARARKYGFNTETYRCSFDPQSLDMVVIREMGICVFDSTAPHEMQPARDGDSVFDIYSLAVAAGTDEKYAAELSEIKKRYGAKVRLASNYLREAHELVQWREAEFNRDIRRDKLDDMLKEILKTVS